MLDPTTSSKNSLKKAANKLLQQKPNKQHGNFAVQVKSMQEQKAFERFKKMQEKAKKLAPAADATTKTTLLDDQKSMDNNMDDDL